MDVINYVVSQCTVKGKNLRVVNADRFTDDIYDSYVCSLFQVQIRKRFLFWHYWSILKTYVYDVDSVNSKATCNIQKTNALKYYRKLLLIAENG